MAARRRCLSQTITYDEDFNSLSLIAEVLFTRLLAISDDCGVVPGNLYTLQTLINPRGELQKNFTEYLNELVVKKMIISFKYNNKPFFCFKRSSFEKHQGYFIKNRTKSEYLEIKVDQFVELYGKIQEFPEISGNISEGDSYPIEHITYNIEHKTLNIEHKEEELELCSMKLWRRVFTSNPGEVEKKFIKELIEKFGEEKTNKILFDFRELNFHSIRKMKEALNPDGSLKPKDQENGNYRTAEKGKEFKVITG